MAFASSSSSAVATIRSSSKNVRVARRCMSYGLQQRPPPRSGSTDTYDSSRVISPRDYPPSNSYSTPSPSPSRLPQSTPRQYIRPPHNYHPQSTTHRPAPGSSTSPATAQSFFTNLLSLPPTRQLPPDLSLQILTHKSYRYAQNSMSTPNLTDQPDAESEVWQWAANHNARLGFLGRRAMASYAGMFWHAALSGGGGLGGLGLTKDGGLEDRLDGLMDTTRLGKSVGDDWEMDGLLRWDGNENGIASGLAKIKGQAVEATLGAIFTYYGSPAAHRAYHLHVLPRMKNLLRDPAIIERAESMRDKLQREFGGGILPRD